MTASLFIDGAWSAGSGSRRGTVVDPATGSAIGEVAFAEVADLDRALAAAERAFAGWKKTSAYERAALLRRAAALVRARAEIIAAAITAEQGKPLAEARIEAMTAADHIEWNAEEGRRAYGRLIPSRASEVTQLVRKEPVGPVAAFSPWNFPVNQLVRKIAGALAAGCTIIAKAPEETPTSAIELVRCFEEAGIPAGVVNLVFGVPAEISQHLIASQTIQKVSFTGSVPVGRHLSTLAARHLKRQTMELGGHAPFIVTAKADIAAATTLATLTKFRNAGQVCASATRFLVHDAVYDEFVDGFAARASALKVGPGSAECTQMGPLAHARRVDAIDAFVQDARSHGARVVTGGERLGNRGFFYAPTLLAGVPLDARVMKEEPFGPLAIVNRVSSLDEAIAEANRLPFALGAYAASRDLEEVERIGDEVEAGTISINHFGHAMPEVPFGGFKDSGFGSEGGIEGLQAYQRDKFVTRRRG